MANELVKDRKVELAIATVYNGNEIKKYDDGNIIYYLIPGAPALKYNKNINQYCNKIIDEFEPDILHRHGIEFAHGLSFINVCDKKIKKIVSIQGMTSCYSEVYLANIPYKEIVKNITFRDLIKRDNLFQQKKKFAKRGKFEEEIIHKADIVLGRTFWDYANTKSINLNEEYYINNETLRNEFYKYEWKVENTEKYRLFSSQGLYPIKGLHYLIKAVAILKKRYKQIKLYVAGQNILDNSTIKAKLKRTGYANYIQKLIKKYNLEKNIIFTGVLDEKQMIEILLKTNVFVLPSAIENSSNSLGEAMLLGMPCVATNTGGTMDILEHKKEGYLYPYTEPAMCAEYISKIFEDDKLAIKLGQTARKTALNRHDPKKNVESIINIYKKVIGEKVEK